MNREQARNHLAEWLDEKMWRCFGTIDREAINIAVEALTEPINCVKCKHYYETEDDTGVHGYCRMDTAHANLISKEEAIEAIVCYIWHTPPEVRKLFNCENYVRYVVEEALKSLPPVVCDDCIWTVCNYNKVDWDTPSVEPHNKDAISREGLLRSWDELSPRGRLEFDQVIMTISALPSVEADWIPVSERLPDAEYGESDCVLTTCCWKSDTQKRWIEKLYFNGGNWCYPTGECFTQKVLAWTPMIETYREERENYELATEQMEHDALYEPTYNPEDGSM